MSDASQPPPEAPQQPPEQPAPQQPAPAPAAPKPDLTMAWLPHLLMVVSWWLGPLILWLAKKDDSKLAAFHGKQAMIWGFVPMGVSIVCFIILFIPILNFLSCCLWPLLFLGHLAYGIVALVMTAQGKAFKYIVVADKFCGKEFAEAYPDLAGGQPPAGS